MPSGRQPRKRRRSNTPELITHTNSIDLTSDLAFLISYINSNDIFLWTLLSDQITNISFTDLYEQSQQDGWKQVFIELRNNLKLDEKPKPKRFMLNRLIEEYSTNADVFNAKVKKLNEEIKRQMSDSISPGQDRYAPSCTIGDLYNEVKIWRQLQCERRLFFKEYSRRCSLLTLQRLLTDQLILFVKSLRENPNFFELGGREALTKLFNHCLIIVVQPSGTDCIAVTKYEKVGDDFVAKIKARIICLLDPHRIREYVEYPDVEFTLFLKDRKPDPNGDVQSPLSWKTRTITSDDNEQRTFLYVELNENDSIKLTKKNSNQKLLYNTKLCELEFRIKFKIIGTNFEESLTLNSQLFGLCSHGKYSPNYLTKIFLEEVKKIYTDINLDTHINTLEECIYEFHKRMSGVEAKFHTRQFIHDELIKVYDSFYYSATSITGPVMIFTWDLYKDILKVFVTQMKFLGSHPFLSMMYHDSLFLGICNDTVDEQLNNNKLTKPNIVIRFAVFKEQEAPENPNIIFAIYNGIVSRSRVTHNYLIPDMCTCICEAAENKENQLQVFDNSKSLPFFNFRWYYDTDLSRDNLIQTNNQIIYFPLKVFLRNTIRNNLVQSHAANEQQIIPYTFDLVGQLIGKTDLTNDAIAFLQEQFARWCEIRNVQGSLSRYSIYNEEIGYEDFNELFNENTS